MIAKPTIHPLAQHHIADLRNHWKVEPTLEEQLWIIQLAEKVIAPTGDCDLMLIGMPQRVGVSDTWLWPFTIGAAVWFERCACEWWSDEMQLQRAQAFILAHARDKSMLQQAWTRQAAEARIKEWEKGLDCTLPEILEAIDKLYPAQHKEEQKKKSNDGRVGYADIVAELEILTGIEAEYWTWTVSVEMTLDRLLLARSIKAALAGLGGKGGGVDAASLAVKDLYMAKAAIVKAHREKST